MKLNKQEIGNRYGKALFELAIEKNVQDRLYEDVLSLQEIFASLPELADTLTDNRLSEEAKKDILNDLLKDAHPMMQNFLHVLFESKRMNGVKESFHYFIKAYNEYNGIVCGVVRTAVALSVEQKEKIATGMAKRLNIKNMELVEVVDEKIIAGVIVEANNQIIDGSLRTQMMKLRQLLAN